MLNNVIIILLFRYFIRKNYRLFLFRYFICKNYKLFLSIIYFLKVYIQEEIKEEKEI